MALASYFVYAVTNAATLCAFIFSLTSSSNWSTNSILGFPVSCQQTEYSSYLNLKMSQKALKRVQGTGVTHPGNIHCIHVANCNTCQPKFSCA